MAKSNLVLLSRDRVISIPFKNIKNLDMFTVSYKDSSELIDVLNDIFNLRIDNINEFSCSVDYYANNDKNGKYLPVLYQKDNFDIEDVKQKYLYYICENTSRLDTENNGIKEVIVNYLRRCNRTNLISTDIPYIIKIFFGNSYKRVRDIYFRLSDYGYKIKVNKANDLPTIDRTNLLEYLMKDEYFEYLQESSILSDSRHDSSVEILSLYDIDQLANGVSNSEYGPFDGISSKRAIDLESEAMSISALSGYDINELMEIVNHYQKTYRRGYKQ